MIHNIQHKILNTDEQLSAKGQFLFLHFTGSTLCGAFIFKDVLDTCDVTTFFFIENSSYDLCFEQNLSKSSLAKIKRDVPRSLQSHEPRATNSNSQDEKMGESTLLKPLKA